MRVILFAALLASTFTSFAAASPKVVATIAPLHSIAASILGKRGEPHLLLGGIVDPHGASLKPSQARRLANADLIFWVGPPLEGFLVKSLKSKAEGQIVTSIDLDGIHKHPFRSEGDHHDHDHGDDHADDNDHHDEGKSEIDPHIWLDPHNAITMGHALAERLAAMEPAHADSYRNNARMFAERVRKLDAANEAAFANLRSAPFLTMHDGLLYVEKRYGLNGHGGILIDHGRAPSAKRVREVRQMIADDNIRCVLSEPQYPKSVLAALGVEDSTVIDILGSRQSPGPQLYETMMSELVGAVGACLTK